MRRDDDRQSFLRCGSTVCEASRAAYDGPWNGRRWPACLPFRAQARVTYYCPRHCRRGENTRFSTVGFRTLRTEHAVTGIISNLPNNWRCFNVIFYDVLEPQYLNYPDIAYVSYTILVNKADGIKSCNYTEVFPKVESMNFSGSWGWKRFDPLWLFLFYSKFHGRGALRTRNIAE